MASLCDEIKELINAAYEKKARFLESLTCPVQLRRFNMRMMAAKSGLSQQEIGEKMGFAAKDARKAVSRLLNPNIQYDPRLSTLLAFAKAKSTEG